MSNKIGLIMTAVALMVATALIVYLAIVPALTPNTALAGSVSPQTTFDGRYGNLRVRHGQSKRQTRCRHEQYRHRSDRQFTLGRDEPGEYQNGRSN